MPKFYISSLCEYMYMPSCKDLLVWSFCINYSIHFQEYMFIYWLNMFEQWAFLNLSLCIAYAFGPHAEAHVQYLGNQNIYPLTGIDWPLYYCVAICQLFTKKCRSIVQIFPFKSVFIAVYTVLSLLNHIRRWSFECQPYNFCLHANISEYVNIITS